MKKDHITVFLVIIAIVLGIIFYFTDRPSKEDKNTLQYTAGCQSEKIDASVYRLRGDTSLIGAFVSFKEVPLSEEVRNQLANLNVSLREESWIFDYTLAEIPTDALCFLAEQDFVKSIFIPIEN